MKGYDPVHEENGQWFFWDEIQVDRLGPYESEAEARRQIKRYARYLDTGDPDAPLEPSHGNAGHS